MDVAAYLNNAAEGWPKAPGVPEAVKRTLEAPPEAVGRGAAEHDPVEAARGAMADWLEVASHCIVFAGSATLAFNLAIQGLPGEIFRRVVTSVMEHNSVLRPLRQALARWGGHLTVVGLDGEGRLDRSAWFRALEQGATLAILNHVSNVTGQINPVEELLAPARASGAITLLDASQSVGYLALAPSRWPVDLMVFGGQKGLHGPPGVGVLYVAPHVRLRPLYSGGTGVHSKLTEQPEQMPLRLEAGTPNGPALAGLVAALRWRRRFGAEFAERARKLAQRLEEGLSAIGRVRLFGAKGPRLGVISFRIEGWDPNETAWVLRASFGVVSRAGLHCAPLMHEALGTADAGTVRFSVSGFNSEQEVDWALLAVRAIAR